MDDIVRSFIETALGTESDGSGSSLDNDYDVEDLDNEAVETAIEDCASFAEYAAEEIAMLNLSDEDVGCNFLLSRNRHGTGFWDRGYGDLGDKLHEKAKTFGCFHLMVSGGKLYNHG